MGLRMEDLHAPTVSAGTPSSATPNNTVNGSTSLVDLMAQRDQVEAELLALSGVLDSHGVNMNTSLTTFDGFPRSDIDVAQIRTTRARIIRLKNDYKDVMLKIEKGLHEHHAKLQSQPPTGLAQQTADASSSLRTSTTQDVSGPAFAKINSVAPSSPAESAGLLPGDRIVVFGDATWMNHERLSKVAEVVSQNEGKSITVTVIRGEDDERLSLQLTPQRNWGGRGLLGCHLIPL